MTTQQPPWSDERNAVDLPAQFAPQEHWAWARILRGYIANMSRYKGPRQAFDSFDAWLAGGEDGAGVDANETASDAADAPLKPWPDHRVLSAAFMRLILFQAPYNTAPSRPYVRIACARFDAQMDWENEQFNGELGLYSCRFAKTANWLGLRIGRILNLSSSRFGGGFSADGMRVESGLFFRNGIRVEGDVRLLGAQIGASADFGRATINGMFRGDGMIVDGTLFFNEGCAVADDVRLLAARVKGLADFSSAKLGASLRADGFHVDGHLYCSDGFSAGGDVRILSARIGNEVDFSDAKIKGALVADRINVGGTFFCGNDFNVEKDIRIPGARVGGNVALTKGRIGGMLLCDNLTVAGDLFLRELSRLEAAMLPGVRISGDVQLTDSTIEGVVDLTNATISGELQTSQRKDSRPKWGDVARLILRNASLGALAGGVTTFPGLSKGKYRPVKNMPPPMDLSGLVYGQLGGLSAAQGGSLADASSRELEAWLTAGHDPRVFTPAPYTQLAKALVEAGHANKANEILYAMRDHEARCERDVWRRFRMFWSNAFIGYGHRTWKAIIWFVALVVGFAAFGLNADRAIELTAWRPLELTSSSLTEFARWLGFSFGNAIPIVVFDKAHETFLAAQFVAAPLGEEPDPGKVPVLIAWAFYLQKVLGLVVLSYLAAGVTGLARRGHS